jgi:hypothetical protein
MAELPHPDQVRVLLTDPKIPTAELDRHGDAFFAAGRASVATMFYERAKTPDRVKRILDLAVKDGDAFLLDWVARVAPDLATPEVCEKCGDAAVSQGKLAFAKQAFDRAGADGKAASAENERLRQLNA